MQSSDDDTPVAWRTFDGEGGYDYRSYDDNENYAEEWAKRNPKYVGWVEPLYLHPAPEAKQEPVACPYCYNSATLGAVYFDQNCTGCVKRMTNTAPSVNKALLERIKKLEQALDVALEALEKVYSHYGSPDEWKAQVWYAIKGIEKEVRRD